jgi:hypothetical protein
MPATRTITTPPDASLAGQPLPSRLLRQDLREIARGLGRAEVRYLVDFYYQQQENRKSAANQERAATAAGESAQMVGWLASLETALEGQIKQALDTWTLGQPESVWARSQIGIGPVIAAGLAAHVDVERTTSVSRLWRFAGQDPTMEWQGTKAARELIQAAVDAEETPAQIVAWLARATHRHCTDLWAAQKAEVPSREQAQREIAQAAGVAEQEVEELFRERPLHLDNAILWSCEQLGLDSRDVYERLFPSDRVQIHRTALQQLLSRRPWNARLKVLCWKIGESFVKVSGREDAFYAQIYRQAKEEYQRRNESGSYAELAAQTLSKKNIGEDTLARGRLEKGYLPDAQIHGRAKRKAVKLFLSHYWQVAYEVHFRRPAPRPWIIEHGGHIDLIPVPGYDELRRSLYP